MDNTCVMCGNPAILPEGTEICPKCQRGASPDGTLCPNCGEILDIMASDKYYTADGFGYSTIFHCNKCHNDWEREEEYIAKPVVFKRKYWG